MNTARHTANFMWTQTDLAKERSEYNSGYLLMLGLLWCIRDFANKPTTYRSKPTKRELRKEGGGV